MAQITFEIPDKHIPTFIECYGERYDLDVSTGAIDGSIITKSQYAKEKAFRHLAKKVKIWNKQKLSDAIEDIDITKN